MDVDVGVSASNSAANKSSLATTYGGISFGPQNATGSGLSTTALFIIAAALVALVFIFKGGKL